MKREREKKITRLHLILFGLVITIAVIVIVSVKLGGSKKIERYKKLEKDLNIATMYYYGSKEDEIEKGKMKIITMKTIVANGYLQDEITSKCDGYTIISNYRIAGEYEISYDSYIKCGDSYKTPDFEEEYLK
jgi:hypothetical protein